MSKFGVLVMGPAGSGKTTFCSALISYIRNNRRACFYVNLDPAAEAFDYEPDLDIKDLITLEDVMEEMGLGPNGGLIACFEYTSLFLVLFAFASILIALVDFFSKTSTS